MIEADAASRAPAAAPSAARRTSWWTARLRRAVLDRLAHLSRGELVVRDGSERFTFGRRTADCDVTATIRVEDPRFWSAIAFEGSVGAGASYADGYWDSNDVVAVVRVFAANRAALETIDRGFARLGALALAAWHRRRRNTKEGSARNIRDHYDLGNEFFRSFLDESLAYSCAVFERADLSLAEAQHAKFERVCRKLELRPGHRVLEIGTGWGGFAIHAARRHGVHVTTTTISKSQYELAAERVREAGVADRVTLLTRDYRDLEGRFDRVVSIEMIEAVGHEFLDFYFRACSDRLTEDGAMLLQAITIQDQHYDSARRGVDFIQRYVFPGSVIPSVEAIAGAVRRATDLRFFHLEDIGPHYAPTLRAWRERLYASRERVRGLGMDERFLRLFEFYFAYCEGGFEERVLGDVQLLLTKPRCRIGACPIVPPLDDRAIAVV